MKIPSRNIGYEGELLAEKYLTSKGYQILQKNFTVKGAEIDIIAKDPPYVVFVEVKNYSREDYGSMLEKINKKKQQRIVFAAKVYLSRINALDTLVRFDVLTILKNLDNSNKITLIKDAFRNE